MAKPKTLLVVDDDSQISMFVKEFFLREGYNALVTDDAEKAVRFAEKVQPDLLVIDVRMPKIDGFGVLAKVREKTPHILTVVVSAFVEEEDVKQKIEAAKVQVVIKKPVKFADLERAILKLLEVTKEEIREKIPPEGRPEIHILFVDDEIEITDFFNETLNDYGFHTEIANSGEEGLEKVKAKPYDILLTDVSMGQMSGVEMVRRIREECPTQPGIIAVASANIISEVKEKFRGLQVNTFFSKPVSLEAIIQWLESQIPELVAKRKRNRTPSGGEG